MRRIPHIFAATLIILTVFVLNGRPDEPGAPVGPVAPAPVAQTELGVVELIDVEARRLHVQTVTGGLDSITLPDGIDPLSFSAGSLVEATGMRDPSSLVLQATAISLVTDRNIAIVSPNQLSNVTSPLIVQGFARTPGDLLGFRVKDSGGTVRRDGVVSVFPSQPGWYGVFQIEIFLPAMPAPDFTIELYGFSLTDASEINHTERSLTLISIDLTPLSIYFRNAGQGSACTDVFPISRTVAETSAVGRAAMRELVNGPTESELALGYTSAIPNQLVLSSLVIGARTASVDLSANVLTLPLCSQQTIHAQIEATLLQFPSVEEVIMTVGGDQTLRFDP